MTTSIDDYVDKILQIYPFLTRSELTEILQHGFESMYSITRRGGDICAKNSVGGIYIGYKQKDHLEACQYMAWKTRKKNRMLYEYLHNDYDGVYYFSLSDEEYEKYCNKRASEKKYTFHNIILCKLKEETFLNMKHNHFFKIYYPIDAGFIVHKARLSSTSHKYFAHRDKNNKIIELDD